MFWQVVQAISEVLPSKDKESRFGVGMWNIARWCGARVGRVWVRLGCWLHVSVI